jgi:hypothetical protein
VLNAFSENAALWPDICALGGSTAIVPESVRGRSTLAKLEASHIQQIDSKQNASVIRSAKADRKVGFFFMTRLLTLPRARNP